MTTFSFLRFLIGPFPFVLVSYLLICFKKISVLHLFFWGNLIHFKAIQAVILISSGVNSYLIVDFLNFLNTLDFLMYFYSYFLLRYNWHTTINLRGIIIIELIHLYIAIWSFLCFSVLEFETLFWIGYILSLSSSCSSA